MTKFESDPRTRNHTQVVILVAMMGAHAAAVEEGFVATGKAG